MRISIVIPTINQTKMLFDCIESFVNYNGKEHEIIVVEDGSVLGIQAQVQTYCAKNGYKFIPNQVNSGFSVTVNKGIRAASGDIVVLVNNDVKFTRPVVDEFVETFERDPMIGVVGGLLFYPDGRVQHGGMFRVNHQFGHRGWHKPYAVANEVNSDGYMIGVTGALFGIRKKMADDIGLLREDYFLSCEDTEYCLRTWRKGWRVFYSHKIQAIHQEGGTRGATHHEKQVKGRTWYIKEMETSQKFTQEVRQIDFGVIDSCVNSANLEMLSGKKAEARPAKKEESVQAIAVSEPEKLNMSGKLVEFRRMGALGDVLQATPIVREFKRRHPDSEIIFTTFCGDVLRNNPYISKVVIDISKSDRKPDVSYNLDLVYENNPRSSVVDAYASYVFGKRDFSSRGDLFSVDTDFTRLAPKVSGVKLGQDRVAVLHMSRSWENRTWPRDRWMAVVRGLVTRGYKVLAIGRGGDFRADLLNGVTNLVDMLDLFEVRELIKRSSVFIGMDSGMFHVAQTTDTPTVGLFTVANPEFRVTRPDNTAALVPKISCKFCLHEEKPPVTYVGCKIGTRQCLTDITPDEVLHSVESFRR